MNTYMKAALILLLAVACARPSYAGTTTRTYTFPCPGGGNSTHKITTDDETGRVESVESSNCGGVTKTVYYSYAEHLVNTINPVSGSTTITNSGVNFEVSVASKVEIVSIYTASVAFTYVGTVPANTSTAIWAGLSSGAYILVARDPSTLTATATYTFFY